MRLAPALAVLCLLFLSLPVRADEEEQSTTLTIGSKAPPLDIAHYVKGVEMDRRGNFVPITSFEADQVYVVEFWATWCGPCVGGMPHLSELQEKYKDKGVTIIGVSDESLPKVVNFLFQTYKHDGKVHNERARYTLTTDPDQSVKRDYFQAAGQSGIPTAFVVGKDGHIEWIGHPSSMDAALEAVVAGTWDRDAFKVTFEQNEAYKREMRKASGAIRAARKAGDWDKVISIYDGLIENNPDAAGLYHQKFIALLTDAKRPADAYALGKTVLEKAWDNSMMLNDIAWTVVDNQAVTVRDLDFAMKAAARANELTRSEDPAILDTLARVHFDKGDVAAALKWQELAVKHAGDDDMGAQIRGVLEKYKKAAGKQ